LLLAILGEVLVKPKGAFQLRRYLKEKIAYAE